MDQNSYRVWRSDSTPDPALTDEVDARWRQLLGDSKQAAKSLRDWVAHADDRLEIGAVLLRALRRREKAGADKKLLDRLESLEHRIAAIEQRLNNLSQHDKTPLPRAA